MNPELNNATFVVDRHTQTGDEDGTPITSRSQVSIEGWFDEPNIRGKLETQRVDTSVPTMTRIAMFAFEVDAGLQHHDEGEVVFFSGSSAGRWTVERIDSIPIPGGVSHFEAILKRLEESR